MAALNKKLQRQFDRMEEKKRRLISIASNLSAEAYACQPDETTWSPGQIINHLYLSEKLSLAYLRKKMSYPETIPSYTLKSWWNTCLAKAILLSPKKLKAPAGIDMWQHKALPIPELSQQWDALRNEMKNYLVDSYPDFHDKLVYNHPFAGRMTMLQMLIFFNDHIDHHTRQLHRVVRRLKADVETR